jgi:general secretion pathway protein D
LVVDTAQRIARVRQLFTDLTPSQVSVDSASIGQAPSVQTLADTASTADIVQSGIAYFSPQFTEAEEMGEPLREALGESVIVAVYPEENRIMVKGTPDDLRLASEAIRQLDRPRPQVRITAMIYDVSLKEVERLGINWSARPHSKSLALSDLNDPETLRFRNVVSATTGLITDPAAPGAANFAISTINDTVNVDTLLQALDSSSEAKLLADPSITVTDRYEASIRIVQKIPILAADPVENSGVVFSQVQFEEAGVILNVQPRISRDGTIELKVQPEYSVVADFIENNPVIDSRTAQTTVRVADGQMFALGGLRQKSIVETVRGVPWLKDVKFVGKLFRSHDTEVRESELIVFLTPEVITPYSAGTLRQQHAGYLGNQQLDTIPHAEDVPATPCCKDPYCPNHYPRPRLNGGTRSLEMMGEGAMIPAEQYSTQEIEIVDEYSHEPSEESYQDDVSQQATPDRSPNVVIHEVYPPIHIEARASQ